MTTKKPEISAADIARKHGKSPREARVALRAAGYRAPYKHSDLAKITAIIRGDSKPKATPKPRKAPKARVAKSTPEAATIN